MVSASCKGNYQDIWFTRFKRRYRNSFRRCTNIAQKAPNEKEDAILEFHRQIRSVQLGNGDGDSPQEENYKLHQLANVDQTPLLFSFSTGQTYETTNSSTVWVQSKGLLHKVALWLMAHGHMALWPIALAVT